MLSKVLKDIVTLRFRYSEDEYISAIREYYFTFHSKVSVFFSLMLATLGLVMWYYNVDPFVSPILTIAGVTFLSLICLNYFVMPRRIYWRNPKLREEYHLQFSDEGIAFRSKDVSSDLSWRMYSQIREMDQFYFLIYGKDSYTLIPKRAFISNEQEYRFREMLQKHIDPQFRPDELPDGFQRVAEYRPKSLEPPDWR